MSARSLLLGLLIGATGIGGLAVTGTSPLGISFTNAAQQETTDAANQFGTGNAAAPNNRPAPADNTGVGTPTGSSSSSAPTTSSTTTAPPSSSSSAAPTTTTTPPEAPKPPVQPPQPPSGQSPEQAVLALVNDERAAKGCKALVIDDRITTAAQGHSTDMATQNYFSHTSKDGRTFDRRMKEAGYPKPGGENIAMGYANPGAVMEGWMNSQGHRENILNCSFTTMGLGLDTRGNYWTQNFGF
ncbi:CAP domain-containing protein [Lentzea sp. BCCO 10_0856]|uniref:CAP domain-containing protein n=1 Tax=Lentzea miocenica TaxID=3095431 RepID=A0ABU4TAJ8_9PSEU|nr:CAP domain-containing protein [Lentzea sp. BCCO 10_0856]MDX8035189.1 CAP domain-containing protein [Lentzea sp. BCCO 10_0856]